MQTIHQNTFATATYDREKKLIYAEYVGLVNIPLGLETLKKVLAFAHKEPIKAYIADMEKMTGTFTMTNEFFQQEFFPGMIKNGLTYVASVVSKDVFTQFAVNQLRGKIGPVETSIFKDRQEALDWVASKVG